jgi:hypothetical protein
MKRNNVETAEQKTGAGIMETSEVSDTLMLTGLCATCSKAADCIYVKNEGWPIVHCEEFEADPRMFSEIVEETTPDSTIESKSKTKEESETSAFEGLCITCAHRDSCMYAKEQGGVWHCEEYL